MLTTNWEKIDRFYIVLAVVLILMAVLVVFSFNGVFSALLSAYDIDPNAVNSDMKIEKEKMTEAYSWVFEKGSIHLDLTD